MNDEPSLFGQELPSAPFPASSQPENLADWQVSQLRSALDGCGVTDMADRKQLVQELVGRPVGSLRDLTSAEARTLLEQLHARASVERPERNSSTWDAREEDTWIDRL